MKPCVVAVSFMFFFCIYPRGVHADDSPFAYLYTTDSLPKGHWEYEQWNTLRTGKAAGHYSSFDLDQEIEHGFTDNFQASFYVHSSFLHTRNVPDPDDATRNLENQDAFDVNGVSVELKERLLSPYKDPIGLTLYLEPELGARNKLTGKDTVERALESKIVLQKNFLDDSLVLASNITFEPEWERSDGESSKELKNDYALGASYRVAPGWFTGVEFLNRRKFDDQDFAKQSVSAFFIGPALHYSAKAWWASFTILPQIDSHSSTLGEYEKLETRLKIGIDF